MPAAKKAPEEEELTLFEKLRAEVKVPGPLRVTPEITLYCPTKTQLEKSQNAETEEESNRILIGEFYDKLVEQFGGEAPHLWAEFNKAYLDHFFGVPSEPSN